jgi:peptidoglycan/xylan/chitin deacetylase (PgdA/CDA1 family)
MFFDRDIKGNRLPPGTVCLTYDDGPGQIQGEGPGPRTLELGRVLFAQGIPATFFVIGQHAVANRDIVEQLKALGHRIGNHTWSHPGLVALANAGGDVEGELIATDRVIRVVHCAAALSSLRTPGPPLRWGADPGEVLFFRAPYGNWREKTAPDSEEDKCVSLVADRLNRDSELPRHYVGPVNWDIVGEDWECWRQGVSAQECADRYLSEAERAGSGIILMHDSSDEDELRSRNRTLELTPILVGLLRQRQYRFADLPEVPAVRSAMRVSSQVALCMRDARLLTRADPQGETFVPSLAAQQREAFGIVGLDEDCIALRGGNGLYLSATPGGEVRATALEIGESETWTIEHLQGETMALRTDRGFWLGCVQDRLCLTRRRGGNADVLALHPLFDSPKEDLSWPAP